MKKTHRRIARIVNTGIAAFFLLPPLRLSAALPEDGVRACQAIGETELIYVGQAGDRLGFQLHDKDLKDANEAFVAREALVNAEAAFSLQFRLDRIYSAIRSSVLIS